MRGWPLTRGELAELQATELWRLSRLDAFGLGAGRGESFADYQARLLAACDEQKQMQIRLAENGQIRLFDAITVQKDLAIAPELIHSAGQITEHLFGFNRAFTPGFYARKSLGWLWGGCSIGANDSQLTIFLLRGAFQKKAHWWLYDREELLAHELCHAARGMINDDFLEEYFAYQTSRSALRRYCGNWFHNAYDSLGFLAGMAVLLGIEVYNFFTFSQIALTPWVILALVYPLFLIVRNAWSWQIVTRARRQLEQVGFAAMPILFRSTFAEIRQMARSQNVANLLQNWQQRELRWQVTCHRFAQGREN